MILAMWRVWVVTFILCNASTLNPTRICFVTMPFGDDQLVTLVLCPRTVAVVL